MRVAVIDCGTNTIRLLVADAGPEGRTTGKQGPKTSGMP